MLNSIITSARTDAERSALKAAIWCSIPVTGWIPRPFGRAGDPSVRALCYNLRKMPTDDPFACTQANAVDSDATLVLTGHALDGPSVLAISTALKYNKPHLHVELPEHTHPEAVALVVAWLAGLGAHPHPPEKCDLHVTGSDDADIPGIGDAVLRLLIEVVGEANNKCFYPPLAGPPLVCRST